MNHTWDPDRYLTYADERGRPFADLRPRARVVLPFRRIFVVARKPAGTATS